MLRLDEVHLRKPRPNKMFPMQRVAQMAVKEAAFVRNSNVFISEVTSLVRKKVLILY